MITITLPKWCAIVVTVWMATYVIETIVRFFKDRRASDEDRR